MTVYRILAYAVRLLHYSTISRIYYFCVFFFWRNRVHLARSMLLFLFGDGYIGSRDVIDTSQRKRLPAKNSREMKKKKKLKNKTNRVQLKQRIFSCDAERGYLSSAGSKVVMSWK